MMKEKDLQRLILDWLAAKRIFAWRNNSGAFVRDNHFYRFGSQGSPDIFAVKNSKAFGIEVKGPKGKQSLGQREWQKGFEQAGGKYILAYALEDVEQAVHNFSKNSVK